MKKWLDLARINSETDAIERLVRVVLNEDDTISMQGNEALIKRLNEKGIESRTSIDFLYPSDGSLFFNALSEYYKNPMILQTTDVNEDDNVPTLQAA